MGVFVKIEYNRYINVVISLIAMMMYIGVAAPNLSQASEVLNSVEQSEQIYRILTLLFGTGFIGALIKYIIEKRRTRKIEKEKEALIYENVKNAMN